MNNKLGKAYANRKKKEERPESDLYETPLCLTWELLKLNEFNLTKTVLEPASGKLAIFKILADKFLPGNILHGDIKNGFNFLKYNNYKYLKDFGKFPHYIITNPPFSLFDEFVMKAKEIATEKIAFIAKTNFFGAYKRYKIGVWKHLKHVYIFNRQVDYRYPIREDGKIKCGNLITGWFIWDLKWDKDWWHTSIIDIQKYVLNKEKNK